MTQLEDDLDLEILRSINADIPVDPAALGRVRTRLLATAPRRHRGWATLAAVGATAFVVGVGGAVVLPHLGAPTPAPSASPSSAPTLTQFTAAAAQASLLRSPLKPGPGQYRKVTASYEMVTASISLPAHDVPTHTDLVWFRSRTVTTTWVPYDPKDTWVRTSESWLLPTDEESRKYLANHPKLSTHSATKPERAKAAAFPSIAPFNGVNDWGSPSLAYLDRLAKDPDALLASAKEWNRKNHIRNDAAGLLGTLTSPMQTFWVDDPQLRASIFTALGKVDGITVTNNAHLGDQRGVSLRAEGTENSEWTEVLFDADDYQVLGARWHVMPPSGHEREDQTIYTSKIVTTAP